MNIQNPGSEVGVARTPQKMRANENNKLEISIND